MQCCHHCNIIIIMLSERWKMTGLWANHNSQMNSIFIFPNIVVVVVHHSIRSVRCCCRRCEAIILYWYSIFISDDSYMCQATRQFHGRLYCYYNWFIKREHHYHDEIAIEIQFLFRKQFRSRALLLFAMDAFYISGTHVCVRTAEKTISEGTRCPVILSLTNFRR